MTKLENINFNISSTGTSWENLLDLVYPKGSVYFRTSMGTAPGTNFGGQWSTLQSNFYPETLYSINGTKSVNDFTSWKNTNDESNRYTIRNNVLFMNQASWSDKPLPKGKYTIVADLAKKNYSVEISMTPYFNCLSGIGDWQESGWLKYYNSEETANRNKVLLYEGYSDATDYWSYSLGIPLHNNAMTQTYIHQRTS